MNGHIFIIYLLERVILTWNFCLSELWQPCLSFLSRFYAAFRPSDGSFLAVSTTFITEHDYRPVSTVCELINRPYPISAFLILCLINLLFSAVAAENAVIGNFFFAFVTKNFKSPLDKFTFFSYYDEREKGNALDLLSLWGFCLDTSPLFFLKKHTAHTVCFLYIIFYCNANQIPPLPS